jgi:hypothetical protein
MCPERCQICVEKCRDAMHAYGCPPALLKRFDLPWVVRPSILAQDPIVDFGVDVFGVHERSIYIENAGTYTWEVLSHRVALS